ncbi:RNI-like protein [Glarea lozoyensis ATCC 20868]|uniref:RNI-like protein n=1 Tax=Glarea lozoyensis (strain ATCC 20868 / MF5171) TaxID=1116229 RepID=S3DQS2_GLAL2|nr:RNI-like protein [Glarea lozoyensis ATCC 20868]EPE34371.1 RNI-like protein [Glarea lozoyensis ATCC 20868]
MAEAEILSASQVNGFAGISPLIYERDQDTPKGFHTTRQYTSYSVDDHLETLRAILNDDFSKEEEILALPRRQNKSQRPLAVQLSKITKLWPELTEIAAIIKYERLTIYAKAIVRQNQADVLKAAQWKDNKGGKLLRVQGPWAGQELDPVDLKGPAAIPMPVTIGTAEDFNPIFSFLADNKTIAEAGESDGTHGIELLWKSHLLEFERGIVYEDGRVDLCKKVVGPTHIGKLMDSLEPNTQITHFLLGNNAISTTGAKRIAEFVEKYPDRMETWYLAGCHITRYGLSLLVPQIVKSTKITNLWLKRNPLGPNSSALLAELVLNTKNLRTLDLETTELGDKGTCEFIDGIVGKPSSLKHLYLNASGIGKNGCVSLGRYLADSNCILESLFISTNPLGDAGIKELAPGLKANRTLKRLMIGSTGLTSDGVSALAHALVDSEAPTRAIELGASQTTRAHGQRYNYIDDGCVEALKRLIMKPSMRWLGLGRTIFSIAGLQDIRSAVIKSELVTFEVHSIEVNAIKSGPGLSGEFEGESITKSPSLEVRKALTRNQLKYYPKYESYDDFLNSEDFRFIRNTSDVRKIDSMYRTMNRRQGFTEESTWAEGDPTWQLITDDALMADRE